METSIARVSPWRNDAIAPHESIMRNPIGILFSSAVLSLVACQAPITPPERGVLTISFQTTTRTVVAQLEVDHYEVSLTHGSGETRSGSGQQTVTIDSLEDGTWTLAAVALSATGSVVASGSTSVALSGQGADVVVPLSTTQDGSGTFSFTFTVPNTLGIASVQARLMHQGTSLGEVWTTPASDPDDPERLKATLTNDDYVGSTIASGAYLLFLTFLGGDDQVLGNHAEAINVWDNVGSNAWLDPQGNLHPQRDFSTGEFASSSAVPGNIVVMGPGSLISFEPSTLAYSFHATGGALSVTADQGNPGQNLQYSVQGGTWNALRWGEALNVSFQTSTRIDLRVTAPDRSTFLDYALIDPYEVSRLPYGPDYNPAALTGDEDGNLFVADAIGGNLWKVDSSGVASIYIASNPSKGEFVLEDPSWIVRDDGGNLYVSERNLGRVKKIDTDLVVTVLPGLDSLVDPAGLALSQDGHLFIATNGNEQVIAYRIADGSSASISVGTKTPQGLAIDEVRDRLYITCTDGTILNFDLNSELVSEFWSEPGSNPSGAAVDAEGNLYVCLFGAHRLVKIAPDGTAQTIVGDGTPGIVNGTGTQAKVKSPYQIFRSPQGVFSFIEYNEPSIRTIQ